MIHIAIALVILFAAALPAILFIQNSRDFQLPNEPDIQNRSLSTGVSPVAVSVLIPARNEGVTITETLDALLVQTYQHFEVLILDDHSTDDTAAIAQRFSDRDTRFQLLASAELPEGWNGKQHACWQLAERASNPILVFIDCDVRLAKDALEMIVARFRPDEFPLLSGFPKQQLGSFCEIMLIPMMYYLLLSYLPIRLMRSRTDIGLGAGCGQLMIADRASYMQCEGHKAICSTRHDGLLLPRLFRRSGFKTDIFDAQTVARVRMYHNCGEVHRGLLKNANEGIAKGLTIWVFTTLLVLGSVAPLLTLLHAIYWGWSSTASIVLAIATILSWIPPSIIARRFGVPVWTIPIHFLSTLWFLVLQWTAYVRDLLGVAPLTWRGR